MRGSVVELLLGGYLIVMERQHSYITKKASLDTNLNSERNFASVLTRCCSLPQDEED